MSAAYYKRYFILFSTFCYFYRICIPHFCLFPRFAPLFRGAILCFLPFDGVPLLTYGFGYYKMTDMTKMGVIPYLVLIPGVALLIPGICAAFGIGG